MALNQITSHHITSHHIRLRILCHVKPTPVLSRPFPSHLVRSAITPEQRAIPKFKFAVMGMLDSVAGIMSVFAVNYINNAAMIVLLQQAAIPISMSISRFFLGARYSISQVSEKSRPASIQPV